MKKFSFRNIIIIQILSINIVFSIIIFILSNNFYLNKIKENLIKENIHSVNIITDLLEEEKYVISEKARLTKNTPQIQDAFVSNFYTKKNGDKVKVNRMHFVMLGSYAYNTYLKYYTFNSYLYLELFDEYLKPIVNINNFDKNTLDIGDEDHLNFVFNYKEHSLQTDSRTFGAFTLKNNNLLIKGFSRIYSNKLHGLVVITEPVNKRFLNKFKKITGKEIVIINKNQIIESSLDFNKKKSILKFNGNDTLISDGKNKFFFNLQNLKAYNDKDLVYIGAGYNKNKIFELYRESIKKIIFPFLVFIIFFIFSIFYLLKTLFSPFKYIVSGIQKIENGNYDHKLKEFSRKELFLIANSINKMANTIKEREKDLKKEASANYAKNLVLANISHEMKTPLNSILAFSKMLKDNLENNKDLKKVKIIEKSGHRLLNFTRDLLEMTKIDAGEISIYKEEFSLDDLLEEIEYNSLVELDKKGLDFKISKTSFLPELIFTDKQKLFQIITNLIQNSIKYTNSGYILFEIFSSDDFLCFEIFDSGIGIPEEKLDDIFLAFKQIDSSQSGAGIGLSIVKKFVELLNGTIKIQSKLGIGTSILFKIPFKKETFSLLEKWESQLDPKLKNILHKSIENFPKRLDVLKFYLNKKDFIAIKSSIHELKGVSSSLKMTEIYDICLQFENILLNKNIDYEILFQNYFFLENISNTLIINEKFKQNNNSNLLKENLQILIAEDSIENQEVLKAYCEKINIKPDIVNNGFEAIDKIKYKKYDILILDIQMPVMDGEETIKLIKKDKYKLYTIAFTAQNDVNFKENLINLGFNDVLEKPLDFYTFRKKISEIGGFY